MRWLPLLALLCLGGCSVHRDTVGDAELKAAGLWTVDDQMARNLIDSRFADDAVYRFGPEKPIPVRRLDERQRFVDRVLIGTESVSVPSISRTLEAFLGLAYEPRYILRGERNALILLNRGAPATIVPIDPTKPIGCEETDEAVYKMLREALDRDLRDLRPGGQ